jgi:hypothetical protein
MKEKWKGQSGNGGFSTAEQAKMCGPARLTASGEMLTGSAAQMASGGQLRQGLCQTHLSRLKRHGHPLAKKRKTASGWHLEIASA